MPKSIPRRQQQAIEEERKKIASHLHDGVGQSLTMLKLRVEQSLIKLEAGRQDEVKTILTDVVMQLRLTIGEIRTIAAELRPSMLDDLGLLPTLEWLARQFQAAHSDILVKLVLEVTEDSMSLESKTVVFRLIQEALNNISKHSKSKRVYISVRNQQGNLSVGIADNGLGFESNHILVGKYCLVGTGINSMRDRVEALGGQFRIRSRLGSGTAVTAVWGVSDDFPQSGLGLLDNFTPPQTESESADLDYINLDLNL